MHGGPDEPGIEPRLDEPRADPVDCRVRGDHHAGQEREADRRIEPAAVGRPAEVPPRPLQHQQSDEEQATPANPRRAEPFAEDADAEPTASSGAVPRAIG